MAITLNGSAGVTTNSGAVYDGISSGTSVTASGTSVDFTSIPSWVKRITVMFSGVSTNGTSLVRIQLGDSGGIENTGYLCASSTITSGAASGNSTAGFDLYDNTPAATDVRHGVLTLALLNTTNNTWSASSVIALSDSAQTITLAGSKSLSATLDRVRITTVNGTDTFDAGTINIMYE